MTGSLESLRGKASINENGVPLLSGNFRKKLGFIEIKEIVAPPCAVSFKSFIHSGSPKEFETGRNSRSMDFVRGIIEENGKDVRGDSQHGRYHVEQNADIVHVKMIRNNTSIIRGTRNLGLPRDACQKLKEGLKFLDTLLKQLQNMLDVRLARNMGLKLVVMKVNGLTYFKKKKQTILSFRKGYTHSRGDQNAIVYIEDTTRRLRPHNGESEL
ncbi:unnamed protein product [Ilex paraguariensis]|uniref:Uncharacterized protein n=1 Tax=Ilex paraguariensis TaxID=185542 RepID=A0ABC8UEV3_9AQUA